MIKVHRSYPAPASLAVESLKKSGTYNTPDVCAQLNKDFSNKCYICGLKPLHDYNIEHLKPHKQGHYLERKFDWENLFLSCPHCNSVKNVTKYDEHILDCCKVDPEDLLSFRIREKDIQVSTKVKDNIDAETTAQLIYDVFNIKNTGMRIYASSYRLTELKAEMNILFDLLEQYNKQPSKIVLRKLKSLLRRESRFAEFKRCYIREHSDEYPKLLQYLK